MNYSQNTGENDSLSAVGEFENKVNAVLENCPDGAVFLAAVSGGADSTAMLTALSVLVPREKLFCLHIEHGLRNAEESKGDAEFVRGFCKKRKIKFRIKTIAPGKIASFSRLRGTGIEAAARFFRRKALLKEAARLGDNVIILTAHTKDDALELSLMRFLRGAGPAGLVAMPARRGRFLRPLLSFSRAEITGYLTEKKIPWREDSTNTDEKFLRNRIRRRLIPLLNEFFPFWKKGLEGMAEIQAYSSDFISNEALCRISWKFENGNLVTESENFFSQPQIIREEALFQGIDLLLAGKSSVPGKRSVIRRFCAYLVNSADLGQLQVKLENAKVLLGFSSNNSCETGFSLLINKPGLYNLNRIGIEALPYSPEREDAKQSFVSFYAGLPLVFRKSFRDDFLVSKGKKVTRRELNKNILSAVDMAGTAAFIEKAEILYARDFIPGACNEQVYFVRLFQN